MRLLSRYLLRECLIALAYCFSAFLILWVSLDLISELHSLQQKKLHGGDILQYYVFRIPEFLPVALPVALLLALLYAITNHARHNEITAIRAAGVSLWRLSLPYFGVGLASAGALFLSNEMVAPASADHAESILGRRLQRDRSQNADLVTKLAFHNARPGEDRHWLIGVYDPSTTAMSAVKIDWRLTNGVRRLLIADRGIYTNQAWTFFGVKEIRQTSPTNALQVPLPETNRVSFKEFTETPAELKSEISVSERFSRRTRTLRADVPIGEILNYLRLHPNPPPGIRSWLQTRLHGRLAGPVTCLVVVLIAVPFSAGSGRRNVFVGVAASVVIFFAFYLLQQVGFAFGEVGKIAPWAGAWLPNLLFGGVGLFLMAKVR